MSPFHASAEELLPRLPMPLAQLIRRALNAKTPLERHQAAFYLWEASLKLLGSGAVIAYAALKNHDPQIVQRLQALARPTLGHWWEFVRLLLPALLEDGVDRYTALRDLVLGRVRDDLPRLAGLDAALCEALDGKAGGRSTVRLTELFDRLVRYRNREVGHGAAGQRASEFYERMGRALLAGAAELLDRADLLAGANLIYIGDVHRQASGDWLLERYDLRGETARRIESLELRESKLVYKLLPDRVYLEIPAPAPEPSAETAVRRARTLQCLHPLLICEPEAGEMLFLSTRRGRERIEYLCYTSGRVVERKNLVEEHRKLLAQVLNAPVTPGQVDSWAGESQAAELRTASAPEAPPASGRVGEFELLSTLGRGGMGVVYRAWQPSLARQVALKCLLRTGDPKAEARFAREIQALGRLEHPHIVKVFTSGSDGEHWYYAMELIEGANLAAVCDKLQTRSSSAAGIDLNTWHETLSTVCEESRLAEQPLSDHKADSVAARLSSPQAHFTSSSAHPVAGRSYVQHVVELIRQVGKAAHALHEAGVIHRDIKPGNIMVSRDGAQAVLMDLGLAQLADDVHGRLTRTRQFVGTLRYASPEQVLSSSRLDRRSDVYSLGATLWELLTLRPLFGATEQTPTPELMQRIQFKEVDRIRTYHPGIAEDLEAIVLKCLEKDPDRRYATAYELAEDLRRYGNGEPVQARPVGDLERTWRWCRRNPVVAGLFGSVAVLLLAFLIGASIALVQISASAEVAKGKEKDALDALHDKDAALQEAKDKTRELRKQQALQSSAIGANLLEGGDLTGSLLRFVKAVQVAEPGAAEENLSRSRVSALLRAFPLKSIHFNVRHVVFSSDGRQLATASDDGTARVWDVDTGNPVTPRLLHDAEVLRVAFSSDGGRLATASMDNTVVIWDATTGAKIATLRHTSSVYDVAFLSSDQRVVTLAADGSVTAWFVEGGKPIGSLDKSLRPLALSRTGHRVLALTRENQLQIWQLPEFQLCATLDVDDLHLMHAEFSLDGRRIVTAGLSVIGTSGTKVDTKGEARVWDTTTGKPLCGALEHPGEVVHASFSSDGSRVVTACPGWGGMIWDVAAGKSVAGDSAGTQQPVLQESAAITRVAFSTDGKQVLGICGGDKHGATSVQIKLRPRREASAESNYAAPQVPVFQQTAPSSAAGPIIRTDSAGQNVHNLSWARVWDAQTGKPITPCLLHGKDQMTGRSQLAFSPDGRHFLTLAGNIQEGEARIWRTPRGAAGARPLKESPDEGSIYLSSDGNMLTVCSSTNTESWDVKTGTRMESLAPPQMTSVQERSEYVAVPVTMQKTRTFLQANGRRTTETYTTTVVQLVTRKMAIAMPQGLLPLPSPPVEPSLPPQIPPLPGNLIVLGFSADYKWLITTSIPKHWGEQAYDARVLETATGQPISPALWHSSPVAFASLSQNGRLIVTVDSQSCARVWEVATGDAVTPLLYQPRMQRAYFSPDQRHLVTVSGEPNYAAPAPYPTRGSAVAPAKMTSAPVRQDSASHGVMSGMAPKPMPASPIVMPKSASSPGSQMRNQDGIWIWDLYTLEEPSLDRLLLQARLVACQRIDATDNHEPLASAELRSDWETLQLQSHSRASFASAEAWQAWLRRKAEDCERAGLWSVTLLYLDALIKEVPGDASLQARRKEVRAKSSRGEKPPEDGRQPKAMPAPETPNLAPKQMPAKQGAKDKS